MFGASYFTFGGRETPLEKAVSWGEPVIQEYERDTLSPPSMLDTTKLHQCLRHYENRHSSRERWHYIQSSEPLIGMAVFAMHFIYEGISSHRRSVGGSRVQSRRRKRREREMDEKIMGEIGEREERGEMGERDYSLFLQVILLRSQEVYYHTRSIEAYWSALFDFNHSQKKTNPLWKGAVGSSLSLPSLLPISPTIVYDRRRDIYLPLSLPPSILSQEAAPPPLDPFEQALAAACDFGPDIAPFGLEELGYLRRGGEVEREERERTRERREKKKREEEERRGEERRREERAIKCNFLSSGIDASIESLCHLKEGIEDYFCLFFRIFSLSSVECPWTTFFFSPLTGSEALESASFMEWVCLKTRVEHWTSESIAFLIATRPYGRGEEGRGEGRREEGRSGEEGRGEEGRGEEGRGEGRRGEESGLEERRGEERSGEKRKGEGKRGEGKRGEGRRGEGRRGEERRHLKEVEKALFALDFQKVDQLVNGEEITHHLQVEDEDLEDITHFHTLVMCCVAMSSDSIQRRIALMHDDSLSSLSHSSHSSLSSLSSLSSPSSHLSKCNYLDLLLSNTFILYLILFLDIHSIEKKYYNLIPLHPLIIQQYFQMISLSPPSPSPVSSLSHLPHSSSSRSVRGKERRRDTGTLRKSVWIAQLLIQLNIFASQTRQEDLLSYLYSHCLLLGDFSLSIPRTSLFSLSFLSSLSSPLQDRMSRFENESLFPYLSKVINNFGMKHLPLPSLSPWKSLFLCHWMNDLALLSSLSFQFSPSHNHYQGNVCNSLYGYHTQYVLNLFYKTTQRHLEGEERRGERGEGRRGGRGEGRRGEMRRIEENSFFSHLEPSDVETLLEKMIPECAFTCSMGSKSPAMLLVTVFLHAQVGMEREEYISPIWKVLHNLYFFSLTSPILSSLSPPTSEEEGDGVPEQVGLLKTRLIFWESELVYFLHRSQLSGEEKSYSSEKCFYSSLSSPCLLPLPPISPAVSSDLCLSLSTPDSVSLHLSRYYHHLHALRTPSISPIVPTVLYSFLNAKSYFEFVQKIYERHGQLERKRGQVISLFSPFLLEMSEENILSRLSSPLFSSPPPLSSPPLSSPLRGSSQSPHGTDFPFPSTSLDGAEIRKRLSGALQKMPMSHLLYLLSVLHHQREQAKGMSFSYSLFYVAYLSPALENAPLLQWLEWLPFYSLGVAMTTCRGEERRETQELGEQETEENAGEMEGRRGEVREKREEREKLLLGQIMALLGMSQHRTREVREIALKLFRCCVWSFPTVIERNWEYLADVVCSLEGYVGSIEKGSLDDQGKLYWRGEEKRRRGVEEREEREGREEREEREERGKNYPEELGDMWKICDDFLCSLDDEKPEALGDWRVKMRATMAMWTFVLCQAKEELVRVWLKKRQAMEESRALKWGRRREEERRGEERRAEERRGEERKGEHRKGEERRGEERRREERRGEERRREESLRELIQGTYDFWKYQKEVELRETTAVETCKEKNKPKPQSKSTSNKNPYDCLEIPIGEKETGKGKQQQLPFIELSHFSPIHQIQWILLIFNTPLREKDQFLLASIEAFHRREEEIKEAKKKEEALVSKRQKGEHTKKTLQLFLSLYLKDSVVEKKAFSSDTCVNMSLLRSLYCHFTSLFHGSPSIMLSTHSLSSSFFFPPCPSSINPRFYSRLTSSLRNERSLLELQMVLRKLFFHQMRIGGKDTRLLRWIYLIEDAVIDSVLRTRNTVPPRLMPSSSSPLSPTPSSTSDSSHSTRNEGEASFHGYQMFAPRRRESVCFTSPLTKGLYEDFLAYSNQEETLPVVDEENSFSPPSLSLLTYLQEDRIKREKRSLLERFLLSSAFSLPSFSSSLILDDPVGTALVNDEASVGKGYRRVADRLFSEVLSKYYPEHRQTLWSKLDSSYTLANRAKTFSLMNLLLTRSSLSSDESQREIGGNKIEGGMNESGEILLRGVSEERTRHHMEECQIRGRENIFECANYEGMAVQMYYLDNLYTARRTFKKVKEAGVYKTAQELLELSPFFPPSVYNSSSSNTPAVGQSTPSEPVGEDSFDLSMLPQMIEEVVLEGEEESPSISARDLEEIPKQQSTTAIGEDSLSILLAPLKDFASAALTRSSPLDLEQFSSLSLPQALELLKNGICVLLQAVNATDSSLREGFSIYGRKDSGWGREEACECNGREEWEEGKEKERSIFSAFELDKSGPSFSLRILNQGIERLLQTLISVGISNQCSGLSALLQELSDEDATMKERIIHCLKEHWDLLAGRQKSGIFSGKIRMNEEFIWSKEVDKEKGEDLGVAVSHECLERFSHLILDSEDTDSAGDKNLAGTVTTSASLDCSGEYEEEYGEGKDKQESVKEVEEGKLGEGQAGREESTSRYIYPLLVPHRSSSPLAPFPLDIASLEEKAQECHFYPALSLTKRLTQLLDQRSYALNAQQSPSWLHPVISHKDYQMISLSTKDATEQQQQTLDLLLSFISSSSSSSFSSLSTSLPSSNTLPIPPPLESSSPSILAHLSAIDSMASHPLLLSIFSSIASSLHVESLFQAPLKYLTSLSDVFAAVLRLLLRKVIISKETDDQALLSKGVFLSLMFAKDDVEKRFSKEDAGLWSRWIISRICLLQTLNEVYEWVEGEKRAHEANSILKKEEIESSEEDEEEEIEKWEKGKNWRLKRPDHLEDVLHNPFAKEAMRKVHDWLADRTRKLRNPEAAEIISMLESQGRIQRPEEKKQEKGVWNLLRRSFASDGDARETRESERKKEDFDTSDGEDAKEEKKSDKKADLLPPPDDVALSMRYLEEILPYSLKRKKDNSLCIVRNNFLHTKISEQAKLGALHIRSELCRYVAWSSPLNPTLEKVLPCTLLPSSSDVVGSLLTSWAISSPYTLFPLFPRRRRSNTSLLPPLASSQLTSSILQRMFISRPPSLLSHPSPLSPWQSHAFHALFTSPSLLLSFSASLDAASKTAFSSYSGEAHSGGVGDGPFSAFFSQIAPVSEYHATTLTDGVSKKIMKRMLKRNSVFGGDLESSLGSKHSPRAFTEFLHYLTHYSPHTFLSPGMGSLENVMDTIIPLFFVPSRESLLIQKARRQRLLEEGTFSPPIYYSLDGEIHFSSRRGEEEKSRDDEKEEHLQEEGPDKETRASGRNKGPCLYSLDGKSTTALGIGMPLHYSSKSLLSLFYFDTHLSCSNILKLLQKGDFFSNYVAEEDAIPLSSFSALHPQFPICPGNALSPPPLASSLPPLNRKGTKKRIDKKLYGVCLETKLILSSLCSLALSQCDADSFQFFLPQLTQALRGDCFGYVEKSLVSVGVSSPLIAYYLANELRTNMSVRRALLSRGMGGEQKEEEGNSLERLGANAALSNPSPLTSERYKEKSESRRELSNGAEGIKRESALESEDYELIKCSQILQMIGMKLSNTDKVILNMQQEFFDQITSLSSIFLALPKDERVTKSMDIVKELNLPSPMIFVPFDSMRRITGLDTSSLRLLKSASKAPFRLSFMTEDFEGVVSVMRQGNFEEAQLIQEAMYMYLTIGDGEDGLVGKKQSIEMLEHGEHECEACLTLLDASVIERGLFANHLATLQQKKIETEIKEEEAFDQGGIRQNDSSPEFFTNEEVEEIMEGLTLPISPVGSQEEKERSVLALLTDSFEKLSEEEKTATVEGGVLEQNAELSGSAVSANERRVRLGKDEEKKVEWSKDEMTEDVGSYVNGERILSLSEVSGTPRKKLSFVPMKTVRLSDDSLRKKQESASSFLRRVRRQNSVALSITESEIIEDLRSVISMSVFGDDGEDDEERKEKKDREGGQGHRNRQWTGLEHQISNVISGMDIEETILGIADAHFQRSDRSRSSSRFGYIGERPQSQRSSRLRGECAVIGEEKEEDIATTLKPAVRKSFFGSLRSSIFSLISCRSRTDSKKRKSSLSTGIDELKNSVLVTGGHHETIGKETMLPSESCESPKLSFDRLLPAFHHSPLTSPALSPPISPFIPPTAVFEEESYHYDMDEQNTSPLPLPPSISYSPVPPLSSPPSSSSVALIFKTNDDLRLDSFIMQLLHLFQKIFQRHHLPLALKTYNVLSFTSPVDQTLGGVIENIPNCKTRHEIGVQYQISLDKYFLQTFLPDSPTPYPQAQYNFIRSTAAYSIVCFLLQVKDRHNANVMISDQGFLYHIDFGFAFESSPASNIKFERASFKLTKEMLNIIGDDIESAGFALFVRLCVCGYLSIRKEASLLLTMVSSMQYSGMSCFSSFSMENLRKRLRLDLTEIAAAEFMINEIFASANEVTTLIYDIVQSYQQGIAY